MIVAIVRMLQLGLAIASWMRAATAGMLGKLARLLSSLPQMSEMSVAIGTDLTAGAELTGGPSQIDHEIASVSAASAKS
jgi:hypothetical protein